MNEIVKKLTDFLTGKSFTHNNKEYLFVSCKLVNSNLMIFTHKETLQVAIDAFDVFYNCVLENARFTDQISVKQAFKPLSLPMRNDKLLIPETPVVFEKINSSFDSLIDAINNANEESIKMLEIKAKMLTSVAQAAVNMENTKISLMQLLNK